MPAFILGVSPGWLFVGTGWLWPCIIGDALFNLHPLLARFLHDSFGFRVPGYAGSPAPGVVEFQPLWFDALGLGLLALGIWGVTVLGKRK